MHLLRYNTRLNPFFCCLCSFSFRFGGEIPLCLREFAFVMRCAMEKLLLLSFCLSSFVYLPSFRHKKDAKSLTR